MAKIIYLPRMTDTMEEGVIASWLYKVGDKVSSGKAIAEVETDKASMELDNYEDGFLLHIVEEGSTVRVNAPICIVGRENEDFSTLLPQFNGGAPAQEEALAEPQPQSISTPANEPQKTEEIEPIKPQEEVKPISSAPQVNISSIKAKAFRMPLMTDTMQEGVISSWFVKVGDVVKAGKAIAEVETDKATMELECYEEGTVLYLAAKEGEAVKVKSIVAIIGDKDANYQALLDAENSVESAPKVEKVSLEAPKQEVAPVATAQTQAPTASASQTISLEGERLKISPLARKLAKEKGFDVAQIIGSGENGRIVKRDIETFTPQAAPVASPQKAIETPAVQSAVASWGQESYREEKVSQMRKTIARRLSESKVGAPHFYLTVSVNMDKAIAARKSINEYAATKVSFNDMVIKAVATALRKHPKVNASWRGDVIRYNDHIHVGVAVAVEEGLLVPVVRFTDTKSMSQISTEVKTFAQKAKDKKLQPSDWEGNTFTVSNLGMFGIEEFTSIINSPEACILAVGAIQEVPVVKDGQVVIGNVMKMTLSCDHRVVDGAIGAPFLQTLKALLEDPIRLLA